LTIVMSAVSFTVMTEKDARRIADEAFVNIRTVYRWLKDNSSVTESSRLRIERAIKKLRVKV
jgi:hypothetical protein